MGLFCFNTGKDLTGANPCDALISNVDSDLVNSFKKNKKKWFERSDYCN